MQKTLFFTGLSFAKPTHQEKIVVKAFVWQLAPGFTHLKKTWEPQTSNFMG